MKSAQPRGTWRSPPTVPRPQPSRKSRRKPGSPSSTAIPSWRGETVFNAAQLIDAGGRRLANHRKAHLYGVEEKSVFTPGDSGFTLTTLGGLKVGILICYDVEFPESVRSLALKGAEVIAVPTALMDPQDWVAKLLVPARAAENRVFLAYANRIGREARLVYCGQSCIVAPDGRDLARAGRDPALLIAEIAPEVYAASRAENPYLSDRRPELYGGLVQSGEKK